ncbi:MAG: hypothetical protein U0800_16055 [Isosphaeraceae bacterium]
MPTKDRPFSLLDAMILVAVMALIFVLSKEQGAVCEISDRVLISYHEGNWVIGQGVTVASGQSFSPVGTRKVPLSTQIERAVFRSTPALCLLTLAALAFRLRYPRPPIAMLARRPGSMAAIAVGLALLATSVQWPTFLGKPGKIAGVQLDVWWGLRMFVWYSLPRPAGFAVALSWAILKLCGWWEADTGILDRLGRFLGICWVGMAMVSVAVTWLTTLWL